MTNPINKSCMNCVHSIEQGIDQQSLKKTHVCTRFPPTAFALPTPNGIIAMSGFPAVTKEMSCSEFEYENALLSPGLTQ